MTTRATRLTISLAMLAMVFALAIVLVVALTAYVLSRPDRTLGVQRVSVGCGEAVRIPASEWVYGDRT